MTERHIDITTWFSDNVYSMDGSSESGPKMDQQTAKMMVNSGTVSSPLSEGNQNRRGLLGRVVKGALAAIGLGGGAILYGEKVVKPSVEKQQQVNQNIEEAHLKQVESQRNIVQPPPNK